LPDPEDLREQARTLLDPYLDPFWQILRNKVHARTASELAAAETQLVWARSLELTERPIGGRYDLTHLRALHRHLFQDVYPFAGDLRTVDLRKAGDPGGWFYPAARLTQGADVTFAALAQDKHLRGRDREGFISGLARHLDAVNHLHPFREGNGRTQRIFFSQLSGRAGYLLRWDRISAAENAAASRAGAAAWPPLLERMTEPLPGRTRADTRETAGLQIAIQALAATVDQLAQPGQTSETPTPGRHPAGKDAARRHDRGSGPHLRP
jgi:cell filamentation protein